MSVVLARQMQRRVANVVGEVQLDLVLAQEKLDDPAMINLALTHLTVTQEHFQLT